MKTEFVAEIGINHRGDLELAKDMILAARATGADIAKFQMYDPIKILGKDSPFLAEASKAQFSYDQHRQLKEFCGHVGIEYLCSVFHPEDVRFFEEIAMKRYKIASRSTKDTVLLKAIRATGKPVIASNGLDKDLAQLKAIFQPGSNLSVLECIAKYPASIADMKVEMFKNAPTYGMCGFSSHCPSIVPALTAIMWGAKIIEHHVRFDWQKEGCDMSSSITFDQLKTMIDITKSELNG